MKISDILSSGKPTLSFEVFPPKRSAGYEEVAEATSAIAALHPSFMSVTCGAGGTGSSRYTLQIAANLRDKTGTEVLPHLTCVSSTREYVRKTAEEYKAHGFENIMALRGDIPKEGRTCWDYPYAADLIRDLRTYGDFCIGGACYPDGHVEAANKAEDIRHIKEKVDAGCSFLTTQMFFDNSVMYNYLYRLREAGITVPVLAGIMPITNVRQVETSVKLSGTYLPPRFKSMVDRYGDNPAAMKQAGIVYASEQIIELLANGVRHIHVYTMNHPEVAERILSNISELLER